MLTKPKREMTLASLLRNINKIEVFYKKNDLRMVKCFCGKICEHSVVTHIKKDHPKTWKRWCFDFVRLRNKGWPYKRIMWKYRAIFTWTVIEREIRRIVEQGRASLKVGKKKEISKWGPSDFQFETTTMWSFPKRGEWATHQSDYRGNWPPQVPRNLILRYTKPRDIVFDPFVGGGTTLIEAYLLGRKGIGIDINPVAVKMSKERIRTVKTEKREIRTTKNCRPIAIQGDARNSSKILSKLGLGGGQVDFVCTHPPYLDALKYTLNIEGDLSHIQDVKVFCNEIQKVTRGMKWLLKKGGRCAVLIGDVRKNGKLTPLGFELMNRFLEEGFELEELIIKQQHRDKSTEFYARKDIGHYLIAHEYLFVFKKNQ